MRKGSQWSGRSTMRSWDSIGILPDGQKKYWITKNITTPPLPTKKCRGDWCYLPFNCLLKLLIKVWSLYHLITVVVMSSLPSCPHSTGVNIVIWKHSWKKKSPNSEMENSISLPFSKRLLCPQPRWFSNKPVQRIVLSSVLPPLCLSIS